jgi:hypothetical protein
MYLTGAAGGNELVREAAQRHGIGLLVQPRNRYAGQAHAFPVWAADNGQFTTTGDPMPDGEWWAWLGGAVKRAGAERCLFATAPDVLQVVQGGAKPLVVGDAHATLERSRPWLPRIRALGVPAALVAQDGAEELAIPWDEFDVLFLGGSTEWKLSLKAFGLTRRALMHGLRVHMGRVNSKKRLHLAGRWGAHTVDGTFLAFGPEKNLPRLLAWYGITNEGGTPCAA